jgi:hypothetical protein
VNNDVCAVKGKGKWREVAWSGVERRGVARCGQSDSADVKKIRNWKGSFLCGTDEHIKTATFEANLVTNQSASTHQNPQQRNICTGRCIRQTN